MRKRRIEETAVTPPVGQTEDKILDVSASMQGTLRFDDPVNLRINGKFEGTLDTKGMLMVGHKAEINANITGETISIAGIVKGNIKAYKLLKLDATARLDGDVDTPRLSIAEGAILTGQIRMDSAKTSAVAGSRGDWMDSGQLAKYLEVDLQKIGEWATSGMIPGTREGGEWMFDKSKIDQWIAEGKVKA